MRNSIMCLSSLLAMLAAPAIGHAQGVEKTLDRIKNTGKITLGYRESALPFSFVDAQQKPAGYTLDLCERVVGAIKKSLALPEIDVQYVLLKATDRIAKVVDGTVDLECGATTNLKERAKLVNFSNTIFLAETKVLVKKESGIKTLDDLRNKRVTLTQGALGAVVLSKIDAQKGLNIRYIRSHENTESFKALEDGKVDAFVHDDIQLALFVAKSANPKEYLMLDTALSRDPIGIAMRKDEPKLAQLVNAALDSAYKSGDFNKIYARWFITPAFKFPLGEAMKQALNAPGNTPAN
ncbi:MAG: amino acid ABC transporter substrate-binding protein [Pseudomonadota bacterium]